MESSLKKQLQQTVQHCVRKSKLELSAPARRIAVPVGFKEFNEVIGLPVHPGTGKETEVSTIRNKE